MIVFEFLRRLIAAASGRPAGRDANDPADMGTAFGLDAITVLETEWPDACVGADTGSQPALRPPRWEDRLRRRSSF